MKAKARRLSRGESEETSAMKGTPAAIAMRKTRYFMVGAMIACARTAEKVNVLF